MSEIKLKAKRKHADEWLLFGITELFHGENGCYQVCVEDVGFFSIIPATIQLADDKCECPFCGKSWKPFKVEMNKEAKL